MNSADVKALRLPLSLLAVLLAIALVALHAAWMRVDAAEQRLLRESAHAREAWARLEETRRERVLVTDNLAPYSELERTGFVGSERRIDWIAAVNDANDSVPLFDIDYHIGAQRPYAGATPLEAPRLELLESPMKLKAPLLHEEDLLRLLAVLAERAPGLFLLRQCAMRRLPGAGGLRNEPHLDAECDLTWVTAQPREAGARR
jgi:hypothetical protein